MVTIKRKAMKKHNFEQAIEIFKGMFEGWSVVFINGSKEPLMGVGFNSEGEIVTGQHHSFLFDQISHLKQTQPMNGDEVWAWDADDEEEEEKHRLIYIGKSNDGRHVCFNEKTHYCYMWRHVELITPTRKLTIQEATELLKRGEKVNELFEIVK